MSDSDSSPDEILYSQVLLVEDQPETARANLRWLKRAGLSVDYAPSFARAVELISREDSRYEAGVLDHNLPDGDSLELVSMLTDNDPTCSSMVLTGMEGEALAKEYRGRGAFRFVNKPVGGMQLLSHVHATMLDTFRWRSAGKGKTGEQIEMPPPKVVVDAEAAADRLRFICGLTPIQREVAYWLLLGIRDAELAQRLGRAERTAKRHVSDVLHKAGVPNRAALWSVLTKDDIQDRKPGDDDDGEGGTGGEDPTS